MTTTSRSDTERQHEPMIRAAQVALALGGFAIGTTEFAAMSFLPAFAADLHVDAPTGGHAVSAYALGVVVGAPLLAVLGARLERRMLLMALLIWFAVGSVLSAFAPNFASLILLRFLTGLPHGAYFGIAVLLAAGMVDPSRRGAAVGRILMGLTVATTIGAPIASLIAQWLGWRVGFALIGVLALVAVTLILSMVPKQLPVAGASPLRELGGLRRPQVWFALGIAAVGFGGLFAVYTYLVSTLEIATKATPGAVAIVLAIFGLGMTFGNFVAPVIARLGVMRAVGVFLVWSAFATALYPLSVLNLMSISLAVFAIGCGGGLGTVLQMRLMDTAGDGQGLAASLNHSAFNVANALGPWLGGMAIAAGHGWASTGWVGFGLAVGGLAIWGVAVALDRHPPSPE